MEQNTSASTTESPARAAGAEDVGEANAWLPKTRPAFVALSQFTIANDMAAEVRRAFLDRPHLVDRAPGFLRMEVISPVDAADEIWLLTYWTDETSFRDWHRSHEYRESHGQIPKGLKLVPRSARLRFFEHICS